ncbi:MAG: hypothetical protein ABIR19_07790 [Ginsengibacter sp.]
MKKAQFIASDNKLEMFKRIIYAFQVLIIGIAIPALFLIGISTNNDTGKSNQDNVQKQQDITASTSGFSPLIKL